MEVLDLKKLIKFYPDKIGQGHALGQTGDAGRTYVP